MNWQLGRVRPTPSHVPKDWSLVHLTSVARLESGHTPARNQPSYWDGYIPWISLHDSAMLDVSEITRTELTVSQEGIANSSARLLPKGTVVFSRTATVGKSTIMGHEMATSQDFANFICGSRLHNRYLMFLFRFMSSEWTRLMAGSTHNTIYMPVFQQLQILLPPLAEQEAIASALSDADTWIESLEQLIAKKRQIKQGAMQELLTGKRRLPGFSGEWETKRLGDVALLRNGYAFKSDTYAVLGSFKVVTIANVQDGRMEMAECNSLEILPRDLQVHHQLSVGDLLISMTGNVGRVCRVSHPNCLLNQRVGLVVPLSTSVEFLYNLLRQRFFLAAMARKAKGGAQGNLSKVDILEFEMTIPNSLDEQQSIATVLSDMDTEIESLESKLAKAREIKQGLMQELLTGRIRLV
jgi:type I restriction enzyme S subunit